MYERRNSAYLRSIPWDTEYALDSESSPPDKFKPFASGLEAWGLDIQGEVGFGPIARSFLESGTLGDVGARHTSLIAGYVAHLRAYDMVMRADQNIPPSTATSPAYRNPERRAQLIQDVAPKLSNWVKVIESATKKKAMLDAPNSNIPLSGPSTTPETPIQRLNKITAHLIRSKNVATPVLNVFVASWHLAGLIKGKTALKAEDAPDILGDQKKRNDLKVSQLTKPLRLAMLVSPILLLTERAQYRRAKDSGEQLEAIQMFSNKDEHIIQVENIILRSMVQLASDETHNSLEVIRDMYQQLEAYLNANRPACEAVKDWFVATPPTTTPPEISSQATLDESEVMQELGVTMNEMAVDDMDEDPPSPPKETLVETPPLGDAATVTSKGNSDGGMAVDGEEVAGATGEVSDKSDGEGTDDEMEVDLEQGKGNSGAVGGEQATPSRPDGSAIKKGTGQPDAAGSDGGLTLDKLASVTGPEKEKTLEPDTGSGDGGSNEQFPDIDMEVEQETSQAAPTGSDGGSANETAPSIDNADKMTGPQTRMRTDPDSQSTSSEEEDDSESEQEVKKKEEEEAKKKKYEEAARKKKEEEAAKKKKKKKRVGNGQKNASTSSNVTTDTPSAPNLKRGRAAEKPVLDLHGLDEDRLVSLTQLARIRRVPNFSLATPPHRREKDDREKLHTTLSLPYNKANRPLCVSASSPFNSSETIPFPLYHIDPMMSFLSHAKPATVFTLDGVQRYIKTADLYGYKGRAWPAAFNKDTIAKVVGPIDGCKIYTYDYRAFWINDFTTTLTTTLPGRPLATEPIRLLQSTHYTIPGHLSSDVHAWKTTINSGYWFCSSNCSKPEKDLQHLLVTQAGFTHRREVVPFGFWRSVCSVVGDCVLFTAIPSTETLAEAEHHDPQQVSSRTHRLGIISLKSGQQLYLPPGTAVQVHAVKGNIAAMTHFYVIATMEHTCRHIISSLISGQIFNNYSLGGRELINRIIIHLHRLLIKEKFWATLLDNQDAYAEELARLHLPDPRSADGLTSILWLLVFAEYAHVIHPGTYHEEGIDKSERMVMVKVRLSARHILLYLDQCLLVDVDRQVSAVFGSLMNETKATIEAKTVLSLEKQKIPQYGDLVRQAVRRCDQFKGDNEPPAVTMVELLPERYHDIPSDDSITGMTADDFGALGVTKF